MFGLGRIRSEYGYLCRREIGLKEQDRDIAKEDDFCVRRFGLTGRLRGHMGCVNRLAWNQDGTYLASVSDDANLIIWPYPQGMPYTVPTLHTSNIFGVQFLPHTNSSVLVTGAMDHTVGLHRILEGGGNLIPIHGPRYDGFFREENDPPVDVGEDGRMEDDSVVGGGQQGDYPLAEHTFFSCHTDRVKDVEVSQADPNMFWSASEDGTVRQYDYRMDPRAQSEVESPNVLLRFRNLTSYPYKGISSLRINPRRPEMLAVTSQDTNVCVFDRRKLTPHVWDSLPFTDSGYSGGEPILSLTSPSVDMYSNFIGVSNYRYPTYVTFGSGGDKVLATYFQGPAVSWSCLTSDSKSAKATPLGGFPEAFEFDNSMREISFFGNRDRVDRKESLMWHTAAMPHGCQKPPKAQAWTLRCLKHALSENPHDYVLYCRLCDTYLQRRLPTPSHLFAILQSAEYAVRVAPKDRVHPYIVLMDALKKCEFVLASLLILKVMEKTMKGKCAEYDALDAEGDLTAFRNEFFRGVQKEYKTSKAMLDKLLDSTLRGEIPQEWIDMTSQMLSPLMFEMNYMKAWGMSYTKGLPTPIMSLGHRDENFIQSYGHHSHVHTDIQEAVFFGRNDEYVISASDTGYAVIYNANSGEVENFLRADAEILNCVRPHPILPVLATSGIESTVKVWTPYGGQKDGCAFVDPESWPSFADVEQGTDPDLAQSFMDPFIDLLTGRAGFNMADPMQSQFGGLSGGGDEGEDDYDMPMYRSPMQHLMDMYVHHGAAFMGDDDDIEEDDDEIY
ncbi:WD and tetratricopeptide repeats protein 1 [Picochlorum sp. SENEW3]|nr:WD and tetratricopeptide repeats protein 1 [Picochlorum sp. SENEW3]